MAALGNASSSAANATLGSLGLGGHEPFRVELRWVVLGVYPVSTAFFWLLYLKVWAPFTVWLLASRQKTLERWSPLQHACFYANANSVLHTYLVVILLVAMLASDDGIWSERLHRHSNDLGHAAMSFSLVRPPCCVSPRAPLSDSADCHVRTRTRWWP